MYDQKESEENEENERRSVTVRHREEATDPDDWLRSLTDQREKVGKHVYSARVVQGPVASSIVRKAPQSSRARATGSNLGRSKNLSATAKILESLSIPYSGPQTGGKDLLKGGKFVFEADPETMITRLRELRKQRTSLLAEVVSHESAVKVLGERVSSQQQSVEDTARSKGLIKLGASWQAPEIAPVKYTSTALKRMPSKTGEQDELTRRKERRQRQREETATSRCVHLEGVQAVLLEDTRRFAAEAMALEALTPPDGEEGSARTDAGSRLQREIDELTEELAQEQRIALELGEAVRKRQEVLEDRVDALRARIRQARTEKQRAQIEVEEQTDTMRTLDTKTTVLRSRLTSKVPWRSRK
jgi:hypothetical protein